MSGALNGSTEWRLVCALSLEDSPMVWDQCVHYLRKGELEQLVKIVGRDALANIQRVSGIIRDKKTIPIASNLGIWLDLRKRLGMCEFETSEHDIFTKKMVNVWSNVSEKTICEESCIHRE
jgi:hypothetical protein